MKRTLLSLSVLVLISLFFADFASALLEKVPVKLAIIGEIEEFRPEIDFLTADLSKEPGLILLERAEIEKIFKEHEIFLSNRAEDIHEIGKLLGADGLIILKTVGVEGKKFLTACLVSVDTSVIIDVDIQPLPFGKEFRWPDNIKARFLPLVPKLEIKRNDAVFISLLNIRSPSSSPENRSLENQLTVIFEYSLMKEKKIFVLDRWNMKELVWEKSLDYGKGSSFWTGSYLIDGTIEHLDSAGNIKVNLYIRKSGNTDKKMIETTGNKEGLNKMVEEIKVKLLKTLDLEKDIIPWELQKEAEQYCQEAVWANNYGLYDVAQRASDAAWVLGCRTTELNFIRIKSYCGELYQNVFFVHLGYWTLDSYLQETPNPQNYIDSMIYALQIYEEFLKNEPGFLVGDSNEVIDTWEYLGANVLRVASRVLAGAHSKGLYRTEPYKDRLATLRYNVRKTYAIIMEKAKASSNSRDTIKPLCLVFLHYFPYWHETPAQALEVYKTFMAINYRDISKMLFYRFRTYPWLIGWQGEDKTTIKIWNDFVSSLIESDNETNRVNGFLMALNTDNYCLSKQELTDRVLDLLWEVREKIKAGNSGPPGYTLLAWRLTDNLFGGGGGEPWKNLIKVDPEYSLKYIKFLLEQKTRIDWMLARCLLDIGDNYTEKQLEEMLSSLFEYDKRVVPDESMGDRYVFKVALNKRLPGYRDRDKETPCFESIELKPDMKLANIVGDLRRNRFFYKYGRLWVMCSAGIISVRPDTYDIEKIIVPKAVDGHTIDGEFYITQDYIFFRNFEGGVIRYALKSKQWKCVGKIESPDPNNTHILTSGNKFYIGFGQKEHDLSVFSRKEIYSSIIELDTDTGKMRILASSRRRPAKSELDDRSPYRAIDLFKGYNEQLCVAIESGEYGYIYTYNETDDSWERIFQSYLDDVDDCKEFAGGTLVKTWNYNIFHIAYDKPSFQPLCLDSRFYYLGKGYNPVWLYQGLWREALRFGSIYDGKDLFVLCQTKPDHKIKYGQPYYLKYFTPGSSEPLNIPIVFIGNSAISDELDIHNTKYIPSITDAGDVLLFYISEEPFCWALTKKEIYDFAEKKLKKPEIIVENSYFLDNNTVRLKAGNGMTIRYTLDGTVPREDSLEYFAPIKVDKTLTLNARAFAKNRYAGDVATISLEKISFQEPAKVEDLKPGLIYCYKKLPPEAELDFSDMDITGITPTFTTRDLIDMEICFAMKESGFIKIVEDGIYTFYLGSGGYGELFINGQKIIRTYWGKKEERGTVALKAGMHHIEVQYKQTDAPFQRLVLKYEGPGIEKQEVPPSALFHEEGN